MSTEIVVDKLKDLIQTRHMLVLALAIIIATISLRDILFFVFGVLGVFAVGYHIFAIQSKKKNKKSRIFVEFKDLKEKFNENLKKIEEVYVERDYFINNFSKGVYQHISFEEEVDIVKWVEKIEHNLTEQSRKQLSTFHKGLSNHMNHFKEENPNKAYQLNRNNSIEENEEKIIFKEIGLRSMEKEFKEIDLILIKPFDTKKSKAILKDLKTLVSSFYDGNEDYYDFFSNVNRSTLDRIKQMFNSSSNDEAETSLKELFLGSS